MNEHSTDGQAMTRQVRQGWLEEALADKVREWIEVIVNEELDVALGLGRYERGPGRKGYRKGYRVRTFTTRNGQHRLRMPRGYILSLGPMGRKNGTAN